MHILNTLNNCTICPRNCGVNRNIGQIGYCHAGRLPKVALSSTHMWEEPCISGSCGSGTIFFSHCNLRCLFCQNHSISQEGFGQDLPIPALSALFLKQQRNGSHNINLVSPTQFLPQIAEALRQSKADGLTIPVVYNTNGYEKADSLKLLRGLVDIYLPDLKYYDPDISKQFSDAPDYFSFASKAIEEMVCQVGEPVFSDDQLLKKGVIIRHLVLPGCRKDSEKLLDWIAEKLGHTVYVSLLNQYTPMYQAHTVKQLNRKLTTFEYEKVLDHFLSLQLKNGYRQRKGASTAQYTPKFDLSGL